MDKKRNKRRELVFCLEILIKAVSWEIKNFMMSAFVKVMSFAHTRCFYALLKKDRFVISDNKKKGIR